MSTRRPPSRRPSPLARLVPRPWTALWLWVAWLLMNQTVAVGHLLLGAVLALALSRYPGGAPPLADAPPVRARARRPAWRTAWLFSKLGWVVLHDIVVANVQVAMLILGPGDVLKPRFVWVPLDVRRPRSISLLAGIITMTPGTVSAELSDDHLHLLVHGLNVDDPDALIQDIKTRYETPIKELLE